MNRNVEIVLEDKKNDVKFHTSANCDKSIIKIISLKMNELEEFQTVCLYFMTSSFEGMYQFTKIFYHEVFQQ